MPDVIACDNCGIVIRWQPTKIGDRIYCCAGCAEGGPCQCDYDNLPRPSEAKALACRDVHGLLAE
ncbi:MAG TPA: hypothetical protein PKO09_07815 [Anaerolineae bacterium]|nr:hypothetical protein [Anaerolineae bacterium]